MDEQFLSPLEVAEISQVKKNTVYEMIKRGDLKATKMGKDVYKRQETGWYNRFCKDHTCVEEIRGSPPCLLLMKKILYK